ncbi:MAG: class I poly(R)-hydroxyalkanoic acid synthase [Alphaproteobacteria bacterium]|jgi:polyhydroxyalkanoate synthase|nr:class I poly(R)-hydroxyalkanoic acid synthase [Alphaproteobacteria bacterium]MDP6516869.1 class I poly(R)-hydroxyalkanoic acid synthase [Alphaproteobacteria bacterium]
MTQASDSSRSTADSAVFAQNMARIAESSQKLVRAFLARPAQSGLGLADPLNISVAFLDMTVKMMADPGKLAQAQMNYWQDSLRLWQHAGQRMMGGDAGPLIEPEIGDRRFKDTAWQESAVFDFVKQSYLLAARSMQSTVAGVEGLDAKTAQKVDFYTRRFADALAPTNFVLTNPKVLRETLDTKGENLVKGLENLLEDLAAGEGQLRIKMTDTSAFTVGENVASTPGQVIYRNELMELIQYDPGTEKVYQRPLLMVPPWINKYYILDLRPENSWVKWAVDQGYTVFMISWVNPDRSLAEKGFEDYLLEGPVAALDAIEQATGAKEVTAAALCLGGTLLATTLAYNAALGDERITAATFMATQVDFSEPGELGVFIDEAQIEALEKRMDEQGGTLDASAMATTFNMLRANDLIWSFVVNNYLLGRDPIPFDLLYWNGDSTRMPGRMHSFYLRKMYQENRLVEPGGIEIAGVPIDLGRVTVPVYVMASREDHIAPWQSAYKACGLYGGPVRFVLGGSGHIAGVTNAPASAKYGHWTNRRLPKSAERWLERAESHDESWWVDWRRWSARKSGAKVAARIPGAGGLAALAPAPGTYVLRKAD